MTEADIDAVEKNLLRVYLRLGEMDPAGVDPYAEIGKNDGANVHEADATAPPWDQESSKKLARLATDESIVLLKNENNTLPLDRKKLKTIAVIGPWADQVLLDWYSGTPPYFVSIDDGIREAAGPASRCCSTTGRMRRKRRPWPRRPTWRLLWWAIIRNAMRDGIMPDAFKRQGETWIARRLCWSRKSW